MPEWMAAGWAVWVALVGWTVWQMARGVWLRDDEDYG